MTVLTSLQYHLLLAFHRCHNSALPFSSGVFIASQSSAFPVSETQNDRKLSQRFVLCSGCGLELMVSRKIPGQRPPNYPGGRGTQRATEHISHTYLLKMSEVLYQTMLCAQNKYFCASQTQVK